MKTALLMLLLWAAARAHPVSTQHSPETSWFCSKSSWLFSQMCWFCPKLTQIFLFVCRCLAISPCPESLR